MKNSAMKSKNAKVKKYNVISMQENEAAKTLGTPPSSQMIWAKYHKPYVIGAYYNIMKKYSYK